MVSPQTKNLTAATAQQDVPSKAVPTGVSSASTINPVDIKSASNALLPFINKNTVEAITQHTKEKFKGQKGILNFGYRHEAIPVEKRAIVPAETYLAENLKALIKANNITLICMESSAEGADKPAHLMADQQELARKEFASEIEKMSQKHEVDLAITKLITNKVIDREFDSNHQSIKDSSSKSRKQIAEAISNALKPWLEKLPGMGNFFVAPLNERNSFDEFHSENLLYQKAKELGIKMLPIDAPVKDKNKGSLYKDFKLEFGKLFGVAYLLHEKKDLLPQMSEFLNKNKGYQEFIENFQKLDHNIQNQLVDNYKSLWDEVSAKAKKHDDDREVIMTSNLENAFKNTNGNVMTVLGSKHVMKLLPDGQSASAIKQVADKGVTTISIDLQSRDHVAKKATTLSLIPESTKPQYLRANCHSSLSDIDLYKIHEIENGKAIKFAQAYDALITIPKLAA
jgi:hypothetical protein